MGIVIASLCYVVPTFAIAYAWHLSVFAERYRALRIYRDNPSPPIGLASMIIQGVGFALIYVAAIRPMAGGWLAHATAYALLGGLLSWSFTTLATAAKTPMTSVMDYVRIESAFTALQWIVVGVLTALLV